MTVQAIADRLVELCRIGQHDQAYEELFADHAKSYEMEGLPERIVEGKAALLAKSKAYADNIKEIHAADYTDPLVYANYFAVGMMIETTNQAGERHKGEEMSVYEVQDGKIVAERFIYTLPEM